MSEPIWLSSPHVSGEEMKYIERAFAKNHVFPMGPNVRDFEQEIIKFSGTQNCSCLSSGTAALHLALINLGIGEGDEVICSSFTFSASANPIVYLKAKPVFVDSELETWNMDPELLESAIKERIAKSPASPVGRQKPKAIILVHLYGMPAKMDEILSIANKYEIPIIEDAAEAFGSTYKKKHCGTFGIMGVYSFNGNKIITTSGGGSLISNHEDYCKNATFLATQARDDAPHYQHSHIGYNYRMSNICAGIGLGQMEVIHKRISKRRENFEFYYKELNQIEGISFLKKPNKDYFSNHWLTTIVIESEKTNGISREDVRLEFDKLDIESRPLWKPMHLQPIFKDYPAYINGVSEKLFENGLCLPSSTNITDEDRQFVVDTLKRILNK